jgi:NAD(P)H-dependent FMN reductase
LAVRWEAKAMSSVAAKNLISMAVMKELEKGRVVDIFQLASELHPHIVDMTLDEIASIVEAHVVEGNGNAYWSRQKQDNGNHFVDHRDDVQKAEL